MHVNVQGISNKIDSIEVLLLEENPDIFCVSEHWSSEAALESINWKNYKFVCSFGRVDHKHGGTAIFSHLDIKIKQLSYIDGVCMELDFEACGGLFDIHNKKFGLLTVYRSPNGCFDSFFNNLTASLEILKEHCSDIVLCGDLNIDSLKPSRPLRILCDIFDCFNMKYILNKATRIYTNKNGRTSTTAIDYMATNIATNTVSFNIIQPNIADHLAQILSINTPKASENTDKRCHESAVYRNFDSNNMANLKALLQDNDWNSLLHLGDVDDVFEAFNSVFMWCMDISCPYIKTKIRKNKNDNWISEEVRESSRGLRELFWLKSYFHIPELELKYKNNKKNHRQLIQKTKRQYYCNKIDSASNKPKVLWQIVNKIRNKEEKFDKVLTLNINDVATSEKLIVSNAFASYFSSVAVDLVERVHGGFRPNILYTIKCDRTFIFTPVCSRDVEYVLRSLKNKKSGGADGISNYLLKSVEEHIVEPLTIVVNKSFETGRFPSGLKTALVKPLHKKDCRTNIENYRPISLLSAFSKVIEKIAYGQIFDFLQKFKVLDKCQHGFTKHKSTETALFDCMDLVYKNLDDNNYVVGIFFDITRAFDCVDVNLLIDKLFSFGFRGVSLDWMVSFLTDRYISVNVNGARSSEIKIPLGVPQGSVLGPLCFLLMINDLPGYFKSGYPIIFADDTSVIVSTKKPEDLERFIINTVTNMRTWCAMNRLVLNDNKTKFVYFHKRRPLPNLQEQFTTETCVDLLGVKVDDNLSWNYHIEHVCKRLSSAYYAIHQLRSTLTRNNLIEMYYSLAYSIISYNVIVWGVGVEWKRVFVAQKRLVRLIFNIKYRNTCKNAFMENAILTFPCILVYKCVVFVRENAGKFEKYKSLHKYSTRNVCNITYPRHKLTLYEKSPTYFCIKIYNRLPDILKSISSVNLFKAEVKKYLASHAFYSIDEYLDM